MRVAVNLFVPGATNTTQGWRLDRRQEGGGNMPIQRVLSAIVAAALGAALVMALPGFSPEVEAGTAAQSVKPEPHNALPANACAEQAWPYYDARCLHDRTGGDSAQPARTVRIVSTDRLAR
jgi:hypothetical protein